jgi:hypothetical protein
MVVIVCIPISPKCDRPTGDHFDGTYVPVEEPSTASQAEVKRPRQCERGTIFA